MSPRSIPLLALALAVAVLVVQARVIVGGKTFDDVRYHTVVAPPRLAAAASIAAGELPQWWDGTSFGVPLLGEPSHGAMYPPIWLAQNPRALDLVLIVHMLWAALGVAIWARRKSSEVGALVVGVLVVTTGVIASVAIRGALPALAHLPWIGAFACALREDRKPRAAIAIGALVGAVALAGELGVLVDALALALVLGATRGMRGRLFAAIGAGLAIGGAQWVPAVLSLAASAGAEVHGLPIARLVELVVPGSFAALDPLRGVAHASAWAPSLYVGAPLFALALVRRPDRRLAGLFLGLATLSLVVGRGGWPAWLGAPELHVAALVTLAAVHAAAGVDALVAGERRAMFCLGGAAFVVAVALGGVGAFRAMHGELAAPLDRALIDGGLGLACLVGVCVLAWRAPGTRMPLVLALLVAPSVGATPSVCPAIARSIVDGEPAWVRAAEALPEPRRVYRSSVMHDVATEDAIATLAGESAARWGLGSARSEDPARLAIADRAWFAAAHLGGEMLRRFGVELAILPATPTREQQFPELGRRGSWSLERYPSAPVAELMFDWEWAASSDAVLERLFPPGALHDIAPGRVVLSGHGVASQEGGDPVPCTIDRWDQAIDLTCASNSEAYAVVSSSPDRGWSVDVDDTPREWATADVLRRAVAVPSGTHHVRWRFAAPGLRAGLIVAVLGLLALIAMWLATVRSTEVDENGSIKPCKT